MAFLALLVFSAYANSLGNGFVSDDIAGFARNENIGRFSNIFSGNLSFSLQNLFDFLAFHIGGLHPLSFPNHQYFFSSWFDNFIFVLLSLSLNKRIAIIAASIFAVHPILIEAVGWISGAPYSQYSFFFLLSFLFYLFSKNNKKYLYYSIAFFALTLLSSGNAVALFLVFPLYELAFGDIHYDWKKTMPFFALGIFVTLISCGQNRIPGLFHRSAILSVCGRIVQSFCSSSDGYRDVSETHFLAGKIDPLSDRNVIFSGSIYCSFVLIFLAFLGTAIRGYRKNKTVFFWLAFFFITLLPTLTPFKISWIVAERYVYLGTLGIFVVVAMFFDKILKLNENAKMVGYFALAVIVASFSARTIVRNQDWKNEDTLWIATAKVAPSGQTIHNNLGDVYARQGDMEKRPRNSKRPSRSTLITETLIIIWETPISKWDSLTLRLKVIKKRLSSIRTFGSRTRIWQPYILRRENFDLAEENMKKALEINPGDQNLQGALQYIKENRK